MMDFPISELEIKPEFTEEQNFISTKKKKQMYMYKYI